MGARSVNPKVTTQVVFTGDWVLPVREAEASSSLADQGIDVLPATPGRRASSCRWPSGAAFSPTGISSTNPPWRRADFSPAPSGHWGTVYCRYAEMLRDGRSVTDGSIPRRLTGTLKDDFCAPLAVRPASDRTHARK